MAAKRRTRRELPPDDDDELEDEPARRRRPRRRWRLVLFLALVAALVAAAPAIIAKSPLRNLLLTRALNGAPARIAARDASFNWTGSQALAGLTLTDDHGQPVATVELATLSRSLIGLVSNSRQLGKLVLTRPVVHLETRIGSSNLEELAQALADAVRQIPPVEGAPSAPPSIDIEIIDGQILGRDATTGQEWRIDQLAATAATSPTGGLADLTAAGLLTLAAPSQSPASAASRGVYPPGPSSPTESAPTSGRFKLHLTPSETGEQRLELIADRLPLAPLEPWLSRVLPEARVVGAASADLNLAWAPPSPPASPNPADPQPPAAQSPPAPAPQPHVVASGKLDLADVRFTAAALDGDLIEIPTGALAVDATLDGGRLIAKQLTARCEWLEADAAGDFNIAQVGGGDWRQLPAADASITASVNLPQLARMLPRTLQLRPNVRIDSGKVELTARSTTGDAGMPAGVAGVESSSPQRSTSRPGGGADADPSHPNAPRRWTVAVAIDDLLGTDGTREIRWTKSVEAGVDAVEGPDGPQLTRAIFRSAFGAVTAEAVDEGFQGKMDFNLAQLAEQVGQFVDLTQWKLVGTGKGQFTLRNTGEGRFVATSQLNLKAIDVRQADRVVWVDPELRVELNAAGSREGLRPQRIETVTALMRSPRDTLEAELLEPVDLAAAQSQWAVRVKGNGPLESFAGRLRPWVAGVPQELTGSSTLAAELRAGPGLVNVTLSQFNASELRTRLGGVDLYEPQVEAHGDFRWDARQSIVESQDFTFASSTIAGRARGVSIRLADDGPPTVRGEVALRGDLEKINAWLGRASTPGAVIPRGQAVGRIQLATDANRATANITLTAEPLTLVRSTAPAPTIAWSDPRLELTAQAAYTTADDRLDLSALRLTGQTIQLTGAGSIDQLRTAGIVRGEANVTYDAGELAKLLAAYLGPGVQIQGANNAHLVAQGRLNPPPSQGGARGGSPEFTNTSTLAASGLEPPIPRLPIGRATGKSPPTPVGTPPTSTASPSARRSWPPTCARAKCSSPRSTSPLVKAASPPSRACCWTRRPACCNSPPARWCPTSPSPPR